jgi:hypothetical protein
MEIAVSSLYDDLSERIKKDSRLTKRGGAGFDFNLLLFNARDSLRELWEAVDVEVNESRSKGHQTSELLKAAVKKRA